METPQTALHALRESLSGENEVPNVNDLLHSLESVSNMLVRIAMACVLLQASNQKTSKNTTALSEVSLKTLCFILRRNMTRLYQVSAKPALRYTTTLFIVISDIKVNVNDKCRAMWEDTQESLLSGVLDFLEQHLTTDNQTLVATVFYSPLCRELFPEGKLNPAVKDSLLCTIFQLLSETAISHPVNQHKLRSSDVLGGKRLGFMLAQCRDFLVIEALLELFGNIIPSAKVPERRAEFIGDVFSFARLECGAKLLEDPSHTKWDMVSTMIYDALAKSDIQYPQPFETTRIHAGKISYTVNRIYIDKSAFMASVDKEGQLDTFKVLFHTVRRIKILAPSASTATITIVTRAPPLLGHVFSMRCKDEEISITFDLKKEKIRDFVTILRQRGLKHVIEPVHRKQSKAKTGVNLDFQSGSIEFPPLEEKIENLTRLWQSHGSPTEIDPSRTTSPLHKVLETKNEDNDPAVRISLGTTDEKQPSTPTSIQVLQQGSSYKPNQDEPYEIYVEDLKQNSRCFRVEERITNSCGDIPCEFGESLTQNWKSIVQLQKSVESPIAVKVSENTANHIHLTLAQRSDNDCHVDTTTIVGTVLNSVPERKPNLKLIPPFSVCEEKPLIESAKDDPREGGMNEDEFGPDKSRYKEHNTKFNPTNNLIAHANRKNAGLSAKSSELMALKEEKGDRIGRLVEQQAQSGLLQTRRQNIDKLPIFIDLAENGTAETWIAKSPLEDAKMTGIKTAGHGSLSLEKLLTPVDCAEENIQFGTKTSNRGLPERMRTAQREIREHLVGNLESQGQPSVSFALLHGSNVDGHSKSGIAGFSGTHDSPRKRSCNSNQNERQVRESHTSYRIASNWTPSKRRRLDVNADIRIIEVVNQIHETIVNNIIEKFGGVRRDIHATQAKILQGTSTDLLTMRAKSIEHYEQLVDLANEYAMHRLGITDALSRLIDAELDVIDGIGGIIHSHDRFSLSSRFPDTVSPAIPDCFGVTAGNLLRSYLSVDSS